MRDRSVVAVDRVRFAGEPVTAVAAETPAATAKAAALVEVDYDPLPVMATIEAVLAPDAAPVAIVNVLGDLGIPIFRLPATPERVWRAMRKTAPSPARIREDR